MKHIRNFPLNESNEPESGEPKRPYKIEDMQWFKDQSKEKIKATGARRFTYKTEKPTGRYRSFSSNAYYVKLKNTMVGQIWENDGKWTVSFMIVKDDPNSDRNTNSSWRWVKLKKQADSLEELKSWLDQNFDGIMEKNIYFLKL